MNDELPLEHFRSDQVQVVRRPNGAWKGLQLDSRYIPMELIRPYDMKITGRDLLLTLDIQNGSGIPQYLITIESPVAIEIYEALPHAYCRRGFRGLKQRSHRDHPQEE